ncbi:uncharacterized protein LOC120070259 [Benincasa hispida]|uniref:uncharacterized protein LOC120070259 n=1 Tax=Benincasa hispida TaxID=102211 RepID=UPI001900DFAF|nr:uncharacterized protein LOC120070259 [Benincasa hispida]
MAESKSDRSPLLSPEMFQIDRSPRHIKETHGKRNDIDETTPLDEVRAPNVFERVKEEIEALVQTIHPKDETAAAESKEEKTKSQSDSTVIAAKVLGRAKDEIEKILHINKTKETHGQRDDIGEDTPLNEVKAPNLLERAVEEYEAFMQTIHSKKESQTFDKRDENAASVQTEAMPISEISSNEKMPINEVKGPNIFERAKDEMEALVHTIRPQEETDSQAREGFLSKLGKCLEIICSPSKKKDD